MKKSTFIVAALSLGLLAAAPAFGHANAGARADADCVKGERAGKRLPHGTGAGLARVEQSLELSPAQQPAWDRFESTIREQNAQRKASRRALRRGGSEAESGQDRLGARIAHMEQRLEAMRAIRSARDELFEALSVEQQNKARAFFSGRREG